MPTDTLSFCSMSTLILTKNHVVLWSTFLFSGNLDTWTKCSLFYVNLTSKLKR